MELAVIEALTCVCIYRYTSQSVRPLLLKNFVLDKDRQINTFGFFLICQCLPFSSCQKGKRKNIYEEQGKEKMEDLPTHFFLLCAWIRSVTSLKTLRITTCSQNSSCKISNSWPFKRQLYFLSHFPLNSQVCVQATLTEEQFQVACKHGVPAVHFSGF